MKKSKIFKLTLSLIVMGSLLVGCASKVSKNDEYIIATDAKFAPFSMEIDGKYQGIDVEILDAIAKESGFEYKLQPMDFNAIIAALGSNQIDGAIAGMSITEARKETYDFSDSYFESGLSIIVKGDNTEINGKEELAGKSVAVKNGTAGEKWAQDNEKELNLKITHYEDSPTMYLAVQNGNNDFALEDYPVIAYKIKVDNDGKLKIAGEKLETSDYGFAVNKGKNTELLEKFQSGLKAIKENGKYDEIISKYISK